MRIEVKGLRFQANHGCHPDERNTGGTFVVDISAHGDFSEAIIKDEITSAVDYVSLMAIAQKVMADPQNLIETLAHKIAEQIIFSFKQLEEVSVTVKKLRPPISFELEFVSVTSTLKRAQN